MFDPVDYFYVANDLYWNAKKVDCSEAYYRASASRAYYVAFLVLRKKSGIGNEEHIHKQVAKYFKEKPKINNHFKDFHSHFRVKADYDLDYSFTERDAQRAVQKAQCVLKELGYDLEFKSHNKPE